jgi:hypothetical protein
MHCKRPQKALPVFMSMLLVLGGFVLRSHQNRKGAEVD